jgi:collagenase-like PrtC family protease
MNLRLAANYDIDIIDRLSRYPVKYIYGKLPSDFIGGGRPSYMGSPIKKRRLTEYIGALNKKEIKFDYLLNSACLGNLEWSLNGQRKIREFIESIAEMGIKSVTVSNPYLLRLIKKRYPFFKITIGIFGQTDTVKRVKYWESLGADAVTLESFSINRNFSLLKKIRKATDMELILIVNHVCLQNCVMQNYHQNCFSHASNKKQGFFLDYCFLRCAYNRMINPSEYIKASWIRPEDIAFYEDIGYHTFKILERDIPSEDLLKRVKAYSERKFSGNLAELLLQYGFKTSKKRDLYWKLKYFCHPLQVRISAIREIEGLMKKLGLLTPINDPPILIKSENIPSNFIKYFEAIDCSNTECKYCGYCDEIAKQAVRIKNNRTMDDYRDLIDKIESGRFWGL